MSLQRPSPPITSPITVGDGVDESGAARSQLIAETAQQLPPGAAVAINGGVLRLVNETIGSLVLAPGSLVQSSAADAVLALTGNVVMSSGATTGRSLTSAGSSWAPRARSRRTAS